VCVCVCVCVCHVMFLRRARGPLQPSVPGPPAESSRARSWRRCGNKAVYQFINSSYERSPLSSPFRFWGWVLWPSARDADTSLPVPPVNCFVNNNNNNRNLPACFKIRVCVILKAVLLNAALMDVYEGWPSFALSLGRR